jgi:hypothetical protein
MSYFDWIGRDDGEDWLNGKYDAAIQAEDRRIEAEAQYMREHDPNPAETERLVEYRPWQYGWRQFPYDERCLPTAEPHDAQCPSLLILGETKSPAPTDLSVYTGDAVAYLGNVNGLGADPDVQ